MPMSGAKPKPEGQKRHRVRPVAEWVEVVDEPFVGAPKMPAGQWSPSTKRWWKAVSRMPHCVLWAEVDWSFAMDTLQVAAKFHDGNLPAATELRNREKVLGVTMDFRRDLRIRYVTAAASAEEVGGVTSLDDYRAAIG